MRLLVWGFMPLLAATGCWLERVTGEAVPLDPRYYEGVSNTSEHGDGAPNVVPFADYEGETVHIAGRVSGQTDGMVELEVRVPDSSAEGGVFSAGKIQLPNTGEFAVDIPKNKGTVELQAFADPAGDGPDSQDPFGQATLDVGSRDISDILIELEVGAMQRSGAEHVEMPPGSPGGNGMSQPHQAPMDDAFPEYQGPRVEIKGKLFYEGDGLVDLDLFQMDANHPGGRRQLGKLKKQLGRYSFEVPENLGQLTIEALIDKDGDGPSPSDPQGRYPGNPVLVETSDISGIDITLSLSAGRSPSPDPTPGASGGQAPPRPDQPPGGR